MTALTTRQRDLLKALLNRNLKTDAEGLASEMRLTARQVNYGLKGVKSWLMERGVEIEITPGVGIDLHCSEEQIRGIQKDLDSLKHVQLILSADQRRQLIALVLMVTDEPMFLSELEQIVQVSRSTICKDLDEISAWSETRGMEIIRRPNFGVGIESNENTRQEMITALLWGDTHFGKSLIKITHHHGLVFSLCQDAELLPIVERSADILNRWKVERAFGTVAYAEAQLGGRFTDDAVLHLALVFAIQTDRIASGYHLNVSNENIEWLKSLPAWNVAKMVAKRLGWRLSTEWSDKDIAGIAMHILAAPRNERWPGDLEIDTGFNGVMVEIEGQIDAVYDTSDMLQDRTLHDGIVNNIIPACLRQKFGLWYPNPSPIPFISDQNSTEFNVAKKVGQIIEGRMSVDLPDEEINNIALLIRAACIRARPYRFNQVMIVCPSGMATAQLLLARLEARFPRLGPLQVVSLRELDQNMVNQAELIITTVSLEDEMYEQVDVIQVHPLLLPEDVEAITQYLT